MSRCRLLLSLTFFCVLCLQEVGDKERLVASLTEQIAAADAEHAQAKARRNEALDARKAAWQEVDGLKEEHQAAEAEYNKAFEVG
jgi:chromosome segregation ATPase